jgi:hypothetical protein
LKPRRDESVNAAIFLQDAVTTTRRSCAIVALYVNGEDEFALTELSRYTKLHFGQSPIQST